jgi:hypothetical protein
MTYQGHIENGKVVFDTPVALPEGTKVEVVLTSEESAPSANAAKTPTMAAIRKYAGMAKDLPEDASINVDHYLYGHPKQ